MYMCRNIVCFSCLCQVWGKFFCLLDQFEGFVIPTSNLKQKLLMLLINNITLELKEGEMGVAVGVVVLVD